MSKLKDYKDKIKGWPGKKGLCSRLEFSSLTDKEYELRTERNIGHDQAHEIFSNLEFNPAELVVLDKTELVNILYDNLKHLVNGRVFCLDLAQAIVSSKDVVKQVELDENKILDILLGNVSVGRGIREKLTVPRQTLKLFAQAIVKAFKAGEISK